MKAKRSAEHNAVRTAKSGRRLAAQTSAHVVREANEVGNPAAVISLSQLADGEQRTLREVAKFMRFYYPHGVTSEDFEQFCALLLFFAQFRKSAPHLTVTLNGTDDEVTERVAETMKKTAEEYSASQLARSLDVTPIKVYRALDQLKKAGQVHQMSEHVGRYPATFRWKGARA